MSDGWLVSRAGLLPASTGSQHTVRGAPSLPRCGAGRRCRRREAEGALRRRAKAAALRRRLACGGIAPGPRPPPGPAARGPARPASGRRTARRPPPTRPRPRFPRAAVAQSPRTAPHEWSRVPHCRRRRRVAVAAASPPSRRRRRAAVVVRCSRRAAVPPLLRTAAALPAAAAKLSQPRRRQRHNRRAASVPRPQFASGEGRGGVEGGGDGGSLRGGGEGVERSAAAPPPPPRCQEAVARLQEHALTDRHRFGMAEAMTNPASMWRREEGSSRRKPNDGTYAIGALMIWWLL